MPVNGDISSSFKELICTLPLAHSLPWKKPKNNWRNFCDIPEGYKKRLCTINLENKSHGGENKEILWKHFFQSIIKHNRKK